jgi:hypothetical protein
MGEIAEAKSDDREMTLADLCREDRLDAITDAIVEVALSEAMALMVGPKYILEALRRSAEIIQALGERTRTAPERQRRLNELRSWLGMVPVPDAKMTANGKGG